MISMEWVVILASTMSWHDRGSTLQMHPDLDNFLRIRASIFHREGKGRKEASIV
jgi:hypothetical protein